MTTETMTNLCPAWCDGGHAKDFDPDWQPVTPVEVISYHVARVTTRVTNGEVWVSVEQAVSANGQTGELAVCSSATEELTPDEAEAFAAMLLEAAAKARALR